MKPRTRLLYLLAIMAGVVALETGITLITLYYRVCERQEAVLQEFLQSHASLIESVAKFDAVHSQDATPGGAPEATLNQIAEAYEKTQGFVQTGEFVLGRLEGEKIQLVLSSRYPNLREEEALSIDDPSAEPLRRALVGETGVDWFVDYRGVPVVAAYQPLSELGLGIVAKVDVAEVSIPFVKTAFLSVFVALVLVGIGSWLFLHTINPLIDRLESLNDDLEETNAMLQGILETAVEGFITINENGTIQSFNPAAEQIFGYQASEVIGENVRILMPAPYNREHDGYIYNYLSSGDPKIIGTGRELVGLRKDGEEFPIEISISEVKRPDKRVFTGIVRDITRRKETEAEVAATRDRLQTYLNDTNDAMWEYDFESRTLEVNKRFGELFDQRDEGPVTLEKWLSNIHPEDLDRARKGLEEYLEGWSSSFEMEVRQQMKDGSYHWTVERAKVVEWDENGRPKRALGTTVDIHDRKRVEEAERERAIADAANRSKSAFLANMSHELRTPMNAIIGYSEMLQEEVEHLGQGAFIPDLKKINKAGRHLLDLINDALDLSKIEAGRMDLYLETFGLEDLVEEVVSTIEPLAAKNGNQLEVDCPAEIGEMKADMTKLRQSLYNLLSNACKFTEKGVITLRARREIIPEGDQIRLSVTDTGIGISSDRIEDLFEAFTQADASTTRKYGGTGLGLAISRKFCRMMGGDIEVESRQGQGSTFTIQIPAEVTDEAATEREEADREGGPVEERRGFEPTILAIDDDPMALDLLRRTLSKHGYHVATATNGRDGIEMARSLEPAAITLDVLMPGMDGWAVLRELKADPDLREIPVIMLTMIREKKMGYALGASAYLTKPVRKQRLIEVLQKFQCAAPPCQVLVVDDDEDVRRLLRKSLEGEGWTVAEAENGKKALQTLEKWSPRLILLDLLMPEMDGFDFVRELRKTETGRSIPVVVLTAKDLSAEDKKSLSGKVEEILEKGVYSQEELLKEIREMVDAACSPPKSANTEARDGEDTPR